MERIHEPEIAGGTDNIAAARAVHFPSFAQVAPMAPNRLSQLNAMIVPKAPEPIRWCWGIEHPDEVLDAWTRFGDHALFCMTHSIVLPAGQPFAR
jgi:hypothetical protein